MATTVLAGSLHAAVPVLGSLGLAPGADCVVVPTAAAFTGATGATVRAAETLSPLGARVEGLVVVTREEASNDYVTRRVGEADLVVLLDGAALHARAVWRDSPLGAALARARRLVAVGDVASLVLSVMVDPRGGAPTTGLGLREGLVVTGRASGDQLARTRALVGGDVTLAVLDEDGVVVGEDGRWRVAAGTVEVTRGASPASL
ncbi:MAG TPA: hypothetical protein PLS29_09555 [Acidimicrobiales bacterium]|nr:hypothetical protein [Acidimicrobiales bacterium]